MATATASRRQWVPLSMEPQPIPLQPSGITGLGLSGRASSHETFHIVQSVPKQGPLLARARVAGPAQQPAFGHSAATVSARMDEGHGMCSTR